MSKDGDAILSATVTRTVVSGQQGRLHKYLCGVLTAMNLLNFAFQGGFRAFFALIPANTIMVRVRPWNVVTASYFDDGFAMALLNVAVAFVVGRMLERKWRLEYLKFIGATNFATMSVILAIQVFLYATTGVERFLFSPIFGFSAANAACGVALMQIAPDQNCVQSYDALKFKHLPALVVVSSLMCTMAGLTSFVDACLVCLGIFFGWVYLRFFMRFPDSALRGDPRPEFAFKMLFPPPVRPIGALMGNLAWAACRVCGFCKDSDLLGDKAGASQVRETAGGSALPAGDPELGVASNIPSVTVNPVTERRRYLAFKAIDERIEQLRKAQAGAGAGVAGTIQAPTATTEAKTDVGSRQAAKDASKET